LEEKIKSENGAVEIKIINVNIGIIN